MIKLGGWIQIDDRVFELLDEATRNQLLQAVIAAERKASFFQVGGLPHFASVQWKEAILGFLDGMWRGDPLGGKPKLIANDFGWELNRATGRYEIWNPHRTSRKAALPDVQNGAEALQTGCGRAEMEQALARFVKDDGITLLAMADETGKALLYLWKTENPAVLGFY